MNLLIYLTSLFVVTQATKAEQQASIKPWIVPTGRSRLIIAADISDTISWSFDEFFPSRSASDVSNTKIICTGPGPKFEPISQKEVPSIKLARRTVLTYANRTNDNLFIQMSEFGKLPLGAETDFCIFFWDPESGKQTVNFTEEGCLNVNLRVVNNSLDFTDIENLIYRANLSMVSLEKTTDISFDSLARGLLPKFMDYRLLDCSLPDGQFVIDGEPTIATIKSDGKSNSAISSREIYTGGFKYFTGTQQVYLDGYIIDYDLEKGVFNLVKVNKTYSYITTVKLETGCQSATFLTVETDATTYLLAFCQGYDSMRVIQFAVVTTLVKLKSRVGFVEGWTARTDQLLVLGTYSDCVKQPPSYSQDEEVKILCKYYVGEVQTARIYSLMTFSKQPLLLTEQTSFGLDRYEVLVSSRLKRDISSFQLDLIPVPMTDVLFFKLLIVGEPPQMLIMSGNLNLESGGSDLNMVDIRIPSEYNLDEAGQAKSICLTKQGFYYQNKSDHTVVYVPHRLGGKFKLISARPNKLQTSHICLSEQNMVILNFRKDMYIDRYLVSGSADLTSIDATKRTLFVTQYRVNSLQYPGIVFHDQQSNSLVWHTFPSITTNVMTIIESRYSLSADLANYVNVGAPGKYSCSLSWPLVGGGIRQTVPVEIDVKPASTFSLEIFNSTPTFSLPASESKVSIEVELDEYFTVKGPMINALVLYGIKNNDLHDADIGAFYLNPRYQLVGTASTNLTHEAISQALLIDTDALAIFFHTKIAIFSKELTKSKNLYSHSKMIQLGAAISEAKHCLVQFYEKFLLVLVTRACILIIDIPSRELISPACKESHDQTDTPWEILKVVRVSQVLRVVQQRYEEVSEQGKYNISTTFFRYYPERGRFEFISNLVITHHSWLPSNQSILMDTYWNEDDQTYHMISLVPWGDRMFLKESRISYSSPPRLTDLRIQEIDLPTFKPTPRVLNCSTSWRKCIIGLDTQMLVSIDLRYDSDTLTFVVELPDSDKLKYYPIALLGKIQRITLGRSHLMIHDDRPGSGIHVYRNTSLDYAHAVIPEPYQAPMMAWFGLDCPPPKKMTCTKDFIIQVQDTNRVVLYRLTNPTLEFSKVPVHLLEKGLNMTFEFNIPDPSTYTMRNKTSPVVKLKFLFIRPQLTFKLQKYIPGWALIVILVGLLVLTGGCLTNYTWYELRVRDKTH